jgi:hypothetical protein
VKASDVAFVASKLRERDAAGKGPPGKTRTQRSVRGENATTLSSGLREPDEYLTTRLLRACAQLR